MTSGDFLSFYGNFVTFSTVLDFFRLSNVEANEAIPTLYATKCSPVTLVLCPPRVICNVVRRHQTRGALNATQVQNVDFFLHASPYLVNGSRHGHSYY